MKSLKDVAEINMEALAEAMKSQNPDEMIDKANKYMENIEDTQKRRN